MGRDAASFAPKGKKSIFVGLAPNRKGWVLFDPKTRKLRTTFHCAFDESLKDRRCGLLDFVLRPRKARAGATRDEERLAQLEGELYDPDGFIDDVIDDTGNGFRVKAKVAKQRAQKLLSAQSLRRGQADLMRVARIMILARHEIRRELMRGRSPVTRILRIWTARHWGGGRAEGVFRHHLLFHNGAQPSEQFRS